MPPDVVDEMLFLLAHRFDIFMKYCSEDSPIMPLSHMHTHTTRVSRQVKALPKKGRLVKYLKDDEVNTRVVWDRWQVTKDANA